MPVPSRARRVRSTALPSRAAVAASDQSMSRPSSGGTAIPSGVMKPSIRPFAATSIRASGLSSAPVGVAKTSASTRSAPEEPARMALPDKLSAREGLFSVPLIPAVRVTEP